MQQNDFELSDDSEEEFEKNRRRDKKRLQHQYGVLNNQTKSKKQNNDSKRRNLSNFRTDFDRLPSFTRTVAAIPPSKLDRIRGMIRLEVIIVCTMLFTSLHFMLHYTDGINKVTEKIAPDPPENYRTLANLYSTDGSDGIPFLWKQEGGPSPLEDILFLCLSAEKVDGAAMGLSTDMTLVSTDLKSFSKIIISSKIHEMSSMFTAETSGRLFAALKHPIHRAVDIYNMNFSGSMTIEQYVISGYISENWMTRTLTNNFSNDLTQKDLDRAIQVISEKCLIGLHSRMEDSIKRLNQVFQLGMEKNLELQQCTQSIIRQHVDAYMKTPYPVEGSDLWRAILAKNLFDMQLYRYVEELFDDERKISLKMKGVK